MKFGIKVSSNEWSCPFPRGDNDELVKIHWRNLISKTAWPIKHMAQIILGWMGCKCDQMRGLVHFHDSNEIIVGEIHCRNIKSFSLEPYDQANFNQTLPKAFFSEGCLSLAKCPIRSFGRWERAKKKISVDVRFCLMSYLAKY